MDVYRGADKVAELGSYDELRVGANKPAFVYEGSELVYPNPVKDSLVLWYDFSGRTNNDAERGVAEDLSGNGNHGTLQNFNYTAESGYDKTGLLLDGVDDEITSPIKFEREITISSVVKMPANKNAAILSWGGNVGLSIFSSGAIQIIDKSKVPDRFITNNIFNFESIVQITVKITDTQTTIFLQGQEVFSHSHESFVNTNFSNDMTVGNLIGYTYLFAELYDLKLYNHPLTPEEVAHNYAIEKERFGIE